MKSRLYRRASAAFSCLIPFAAAAQSITQSAGPVPALDNIVVTASRSPQLQDKVLGDVSVIDQEELRNAGQSSLAEVLSRRHGIEFYDQGGPQTLTGVFIRGANAAQTLVLIDGVPVNGATSGMSALNAMPASSIERVEILRGSASSLYGANAIGGVINIMTRQSSDKPFSAHASAGVGTYGTGKYSAGMAGSMDGWTYSLGSSYEQSSGYNATNESAPYGAYNPDKDSYYARNLRGSLGYEWRKGQKLSLQAYNSRINGGFDQGQFEPHDDRVIQTLESYSVISENALTDFWKSTLRYSRTDDKNTSRNSGGQETFRTQQNQYSWQNEFTLSPGQAFVLAYEHLSQRASGDIPTFDAVGTVVNFDQTKRHNNAYTGVYTGDFGRHHVQASLRSDRDSQFGDATTWGLSYGFDITPQIRAYAAANTGFKVPTFNDLYYPGFANPDLKPERSRNMELGLKYTGESTRLGIVAYQNKVRDLITYDPDLGMPNNLDRAILKGVTLTAAQDFGSTTVRLSADFQNPRNESTDKQLNRRARQIYRAAADHRMGAWTFGTEYMFTGRRFDDVANEVGLGGYGLWNLTAGYDINKNLGVQVRWNNVLNKDYMNAYGYNMPGSNVFINVAWRM